jgi:predicted glycosyl hydrolase (DUF1957 family)
MAMNRTAEVRSFCDFPKCGRYQDSYVNKEHTMGGKAWTPSSVSEELLNKGWYSQKGGPVYCSIHTQEMVNYYKLHIEEQAHGKRTDTR